MAKSGNAFPRKKIASTVNCAQIAAKKRALNQAIAAGTNSLAALEDLRAEVTRPRKVAPSACQRSG